MSGEPEGNTVVRDKSRAQRRHCGVEDPTHAWKLHAREPRDPVAIRGRKVADRWGKAMSSNSHMHGSGESHNGIVCAEQRIAQEGSSPSGARMRSDVSERGGNASRAGERKQVWRSLNGHAGESRIRAKADLKPVLAVLRRAGCPSRGGIRRA